MRHLVVAFAALTLVSCSNNPNVVKAKYVEIGNKYFGRAKYKEASIYYRKAIAKDPKYGEAYYHYALTLLKQNAVANAVGPLRRAAELLPPNTPDSSDAKLQLAQILLMVSDSPSLVGRNQPLLDEVDQLSKGMLQGNPKSFEGHKVSADLLLAKGLELFRRKNTEDAGKAMQAAIVEYRKALEIKSQDVSATVPLARTLALTGKTAEAEQLYLALIDKDKTQAAPYKDLYRLYIGQNRNADAEKILKREIANNPKDYGAKTDLATFYSATGNRAEMAKILEDLKANAKEFPAAYLTAADFYFRNGDGDEATKQLQQGIKNDPTRKVEYEKRLVEVEIRQGKKEQAYQRNLQVLKDNPKDNDARGMKAAFLLEKGDINQAIGELQAVVTANPDNFVARFNLGRAHVAKGDFDRARQQFEKAVELRGDYVPARIALAQLALSRGDYTGALKNAQDLEQVNKNNAAARLIQASAYIRLNRFQEARPILHQLLTEYPKQVDTLLEMGVLDINEKHYDEALEMFRRAWAANPQNTKGLLGEAETLLVTGKPQEAVKLVDAEVQKHPENGDLTKELANLEVRTGHYDQALLHFQSLGEKYKSNPRVYGDLLFRTAVVYRQQGDIGKSIATLYQAKDQVPDNALVLNQLALSLEQTGKHKEALQMYQKVIQNDPNDAEALNNLAFLMAETGGNLDEALTLANRAKQRLPDLWEISDTIGWIYLKKNLSDNAIELFREIVTRQPNNPVYHYHLAMAFTQKGDKAQAMKECRLALDHKPSKEQEGQIKELIQKLA